MQDGKQVRFLLLPAEDDPDSFVRSHGKEAFESLLRQAQPLSEFLLQQLASRVDMRTAEGRAKFLQDAKPLVKQVTTPMLSLVLRKQVAELAGVAQSELEHGFEIKVVARGRAPERHVSVKPSLTRMLSEMLVFRPSLAALADSPQLQANADLASIELPHEELALLDGCLNFAAALQDLRSAAEHFRGGEFEALAREIEIGSLRWERMEDEALETEFAGAWARLTERFRHVRMTLLLEKSKRQRWTPEDEAQFRRLQQRTATE